MTNFIHIKYRPKKLEDFYILHDIKDKLLKLSKNNILMNMILYGKNGYKNLPIVAKRNKNLTE